MQYEIDLRSDTLTRPTKAMRRAMAEAEVGDDVFGEDPTVNRLQELAAERLGKEAGLLVSSGTQANLIAILTHCGRGEEIIIEANAHSNCYEQAGASVLGGCSILPIQGRDGLLTPEQVRQAVRPSNDHVPRSRLLALENTHNRAGGAVVDAETTSALCRTAHEAGLRVHLDGARIFNASVALGVDARDLTAGADSVCVCLSKGLSAPVGSVLCGTADFIGEARRWRKILGGGMRQAGVIAAAGILSLTEMVDRLVEDHANARTLAGGLADIEGLRLRHEAPPSNMIYVDVSGTGHSPQEVVEALGASGIGAMALTATDVRLVTHRHIRAEHVPTVVKAMAEIASTRRS